MDWYQDTLELCPPSDVVGALQAAISDLATLPAALVVDAGHLALPATERGLAWARGSVRLADTLCSPLLTAHGRAVRLINLLLVNDIAAPGGDASAVQALEGSYRRNAVLRGDRVRVLSERRVVNWAHRYLRRGMPELHASPLCVMSREGHSIANGSRDMPIPLAQRSATGVVPRCSLINFMILRHAHRLARERLHTQRVVPVVYLCLAETEREYEQVRNGVEAYVMTAPSDPIHCHVIQCSERDILQHASFSSARRVWSDEPG
ncbi:MAG: hypothetical protein AAF074_12810 [Pseudomonadota bacterium]